MASSSSSSKEIIAIERIAVFSTRTEVFGEAELNCELATMVEEHAGQESDENVKGGDGGACVIKIRSLTDGEF
jgi:hypothetical protein